MGASFVGVTKRAEIGCVASRRGSLPAGGIQPVATFRVAPGGHRTLVIFTMPESGANYPVLLTLEPQ